MPMLAEMMQAFDVKSVLLLLEDELETYTYPREPSEGERLIGAAMKTIISDAAVAGAADDDMMQAYHAWEKEMEKITIKAKMKDLSVISGPIFNITNSCIGRGS